MRRRGLLTVFILIIGISVAMSQRYETTDYLGKQGKASNELNNPYGMAIDSRGNLWVSNEGGHNLVYYDGSQFKMAAGAVNNPGYTDGQGVSIRFSSPKGIAIGEVGGQEVLAVCDAGNDVVRLLSITNLNAISNSKMLDFTGFNAPSDVEIDANGNLIVADRMNYCIKSINQLGAITVIAGEEGQSGSDDGDATTEAKFKSPTGIHIDGNDIYVADGSKIRKISGGKVSTVALDADYDWGGGQGPIFNTTDIAMFGSKIMAFSDGCSIRRFDVGDDVYQTMAGGNYANDCGYQSSKMDTFNKFQSIYQIMHIESEKALYVADHGNHIIRMVKLGGVSIKKADLNKTDIYPNPTKGQIFIQGLEASKGDDINVSIVNITGSVVYSKTHQVQGNQLPIMLDELGTGLYLVQMTLDDEIVTKRLYIK